MGAAVGVELKMVVDKECQKPLDCSDIDGKEAVAEVARLRGILHQYMDLDETVESGLRSFFDAWANGQEFMDLPKLCECYKGLTSTDISEEGMLSIIQAHSIDETKVNFEAFEQIFLPRRTDRASLHIPEQENGSVETKELIKTLHKRSSMMFMDKPMLDELIKQQLGETAAASNIISAKDMVKVKSQIKRVKLVHDTFKLYDKDENGSIDAEEIKFFVEKTGESMSLDEVNEMLEELKPGSSETGMQFKEFLDCMGDLIQSDGNVRASITSA